MKCIGCDKDCGGEYISYPMGPMCPECSPTIAILALKDEIKQLQAKNRSLLFFKTYYEMEFNMRHGEPLRTLAVSDA